MPKKLLAVIPLDWGTTNGERQDYPYRFYPKSNQDHAILDIEFAEYKAGKEPNPTYEDLIKLAKGTLNWNLISVEYGDTNFGKYGSAKFTSDKIPALQRWFLSNGKDFIIAEYQILIEPSLVQLNQLQQIIYSLKLVDE